MFLSKVISQILCSVAYIAKDRKTLFTRFSESQDKTLGSVPLEYTNLNIAPLAHKIILLCYKHQKNVISPIFLLKYVV